MPDGQTESFGSVCNLIVWYLLVCFQVQSGVY